MLLVLAAPARAALSSSPSGGAVSGGAVYAISSIGNTVYVGGDFTQAGASTGPAVVTDLTTGTFDTRFPVASGAGAHAETVIPDGSNGWYVGGNFTNVGGLTRNYVYHVNSSGVVDPVFDVNTNGIVRGLAMSGSTLYVMGQFTTINGGTPCADLAAVNTGSGLLVPGWTCPTIAAAGNVTDAVTLGGNLYIAGSFTTVNGTTRDDFAEINGASGALIPGFNATSTGGSGYAVTASGTTVYLAGDFTSAGGAAAQGITAVNSTTGVKLPGFTPPATSSGLVRAVRVANGRVYFAGNFTTVAGQPRGKAAAIDPATGTLDATFAPTVIGVTPRAIDATATRVFLGGDFTSASGTPRINAVSLNATTGAIDAAWKADANDVVNDVSISGSALFLAGDFTAIDMVARNHLAAFDATTGLLDPTWDPNVTGTTIRAITPNAAGTGIYVGGTFTKVGATNRNNAALVNATGTGVADATFDPNVNGRVDAIAANATRAFLGGTFTQLNAGAASRNYLASVNQATGANDAAFNATATGSDVLALALAGAQLYTGGTFTNIGGQARVGVARLSTVNGTADAWYPTPSAAATVNSLLLQSGKVYMGGTFTTMTGTARVGAAAVDNATGTALDPWDPNANTPGTVQAVIPYGNQLLVGGAFTKLKAVSRKYAGLVDSVNGATLDPWDPLLDNSVNAGIKVPGYLILGGSFTTSNTTPQNYLAWFQTGPNSQFTNDTDASAGTANPTSIFSATPHFSWINDGPSAVNQRVQVYTDTISNVVGLWHLDGNGNATVGNNMTIGGGAPTWAASKAGFGQATSTAGTPDFLTTTPTPAEDINVFTADVWVKMAPADLDTAQSHNMAFNKEVSSGSNRAFGIGIHGTAPTGVGICVTGTGAAANATLKGTTVLHDNAWHYLACTVDAAGNVKLYVDGVQEATGGPFTVTNAAGGAIRLNHSSGGDYFKGLVDEPRILNVPLTAAEVLAYYKTGAPHAQLMWDSDPTDAGIPLTTSPCVNAARCADVVYGSSGSAAAALASGGAKYWVRAKYETAANTWSGWSDWDWFQTGVNSAPSNPTVLAQFKSDGTTALGAGAYTNTAVLKFTMKDPDPGQSLTPWVEVEPAATPFSKACNSSTAGITFTGPAVGAPTANTGVTGVVTVAGLANGSYHWRACTVDQGALTSGLVNFSAGADFSIDGTTPGSPAPVKDGPAADLTTQPSQAQLDANWTVATDAGGSGLAGYDWCFNSVANCGGSPVGTGSVAAPTVTASATSLSLPDGSTWYACVRSRDVAGNVSAYACSNGVIVSVPLTLNVDSGVVSLNPSTVLPNTDATGTTTVTVTTASQRGYALTATDTSDTVAMTSGANTIGDWTGTDAVPSAWPAGTANAGGSFGVDVLTVAGGSTKAAKWGTGATATDFVNNRYAGLDLSTTVQLASRATQFGGADTIVVGYRADTLTGQAPGTYSASVTYTATANP